jgi:hypothetical protein
MRIIIVAALIGAALLPAQAFADSPFDGTWKADVSSAQMPKKPDIYVLKDGMYDCKTCAPAYTIKADGSDQMVSGHPYIDSVAIKVVDPHTIQETDKKNGKTVGTSTTTVAADGKTADVEFTDSSNTNGAPVTGKFTVKQIAPGPEGAHAVSGSWIVSSFSSLSDNGITITYKTDGDMLTMSAPTGQSYTAKMDGTKTAFNGDPGVTMVSVKKMGKRTLVETDMRGKKLVDKTTMTVSKDGKTMSVSSYDALHGRTTSWTNTKM